MSQNLCMFCLKDAGTSRLKRCGHSAHRSCLKAYLIAQPVVNPVCFYCHRTLKAPDITHVLFLDPHTFPKERYDALKRESHRILIQDLDAGDLEDSFLSG